VQEQPAGPAGGLFLHRRAHGSAEDWLAPASVVTH
jgi:hypothetical protein